MNLHSSVWDDNEPVLVVDDAKRHMRVAGINAKIAWITDGWTTPVEPPDPTSLKSVLETANVALRAISSPYLSGIIRPKRGQLPVVLRFECDASGLPQPARAPPPSDAGGNLLTLLAKLHGRWPEVAAEIERGRAVLGLPPLGQDRA
jgi:hypothetical protein